MKLRSSSLLHYLALCAIPLFPSARDIAGQYALTDAVVRSEAVEVTFVLRLHNAGNDDITSGVIRALDVATGDDPTPLFDGVRVKPGQSLTLRRIVQLKRGHYDRYATGVKPVLVIYYTAMYGEPRQQSIDLTPAIDGGRDE